MFLPRLMEISEWHITISFSGRVSAVIKLSLSLSCPCVTKLLPSTSQVVVLTVIVDIFTRPAMYAFE